MTRFEDTLRERPVAKNPTRTAATGTWAEWVRVTPAERDAIVDALATSRALIEDMGVELDDPRMGYIVAQLNRVDVEAARGALARLDAGVSE